MTKTTIAWGWLAVGVLTLGVNGFLHDEGSGLAWQVADRVVSKSTAVLALASGRADEFLSQARCLTGRDEVTTCRVQAALALFESRFAGNDLRVARIDVMSAREQAQWARLEAGRARMEARLEAERGRLEAQTVRLQFATVGFDPAKIRVICPRVRVNIPQAMVRIPAPVIHVRTLGAGPV